MIQSGGHWSERCIETDLEGGKGRRDEGRMGKWEAEGKKGEGKWHAQLNTSIKLFEFLR